MGAREDPYFGQVLGFHLHQPPFGIGRQLPPHVPAAAEQQCTAQRVLEFVVQVCLEDDPLKFLTIIVKIRMIKLVPEKFSNNFSFNNPL